MTPLATVTLAWRQAVRATDGALATLRQQNEALQRCSMCFCDPFRNPNPGLAAGGARDGGRAGHAAPAERGAAALQHVLLRPLLQS